MPNPTEVRPAISPVREVEMQQLLRQIEAQALALIQSGGQPKPTEALFTGVAQPKKV